MDDLNQLWKTCFSDIPSLAHTLKHQYKGRWVRFHALSESKRCPKDQTIAVAPILICPACN